MTSLVLLAGATLAQAQLAVTTTQPGLNAINVPVGSPVRVTFDRPVDPASFTPENFWVFARHSGPVEGVCTFSDDARTAIFTPDRAFIAGEPVMVIMSRHLRGADGVALRQGGYTLTFTVRARRTEGVFEHLVTFSDRGQDGAQTRIYGALAGDLNRDGWADLTMINEVSADLRVFLNRADGTGLFHPFLSPPTPIPFESSPNEPGDFNRDGFIDVITTSNAMNRLTIARGNGDGTFSTPTIVNMPAYPRGNAAFDVDGDGDMDIVVANTSANNISILINNGSGQFSAPTNFASGGNGPYGLHAADMNNDGLLDLVVGHVNSRTVTVLRSNGNGTYTNAGSRDLGGANWVIQCGDLNADGNMDVTAANSGSANGSVLMGNGNGTLQAATIVPNSGHTVGTEVADLDGDGDLDWIVSCFGGNRWHTYRNNGSGQFTPWREFMAPANPACSVAADYDNDGDLDLALLDEIADVIILMENTGAPCDADVNCDGSTDQGDVACIILTIAGDAACFCGWDADFNADGSADQGDIASVIGVVAGQPCP